MIKSTHFGKTADGRDVRLYHLKKDKYSVDIADYGATLVRFCGPDRDGNETDVLLGFDNAETYSTAIGFLGATIGRCANRIENGKFTLNGKEYTVPINQPPHHNHGGFVGFDKKIWNVRDIDDNTIEFSLLSPDGDEGYPGNLDVQVTYSLEADGTLTLDYYAISDADTVVNLTNHSYFNLNGHHKYADVSNHSLQIDSSAFCENGETLIANGNILSVKNTPFDFRNPRILSNTLGTDFPHVKRGIDHNFVLSNKGKFKQVAVLYSDLTGIEMTCCTDQPGLQIFTANHLTALPGKNGTTYIKHGGICFETQGFPNALEHAHFPSHILKKGRIYRRKTSYKLSVR